MSAAKEIAIVQRSEEHSLKASEEAGNSASQDANGAPAEIRLTHCPLSNNLVWDAMPTVQFMLHS